MAWADGSKMSFGPGWVLITKLRSGVISLSVGLGPGRARAARIKRSEAERNSSVTEQHAKRSPI